LTFQAAKTVSMLLRKHHLALRQYLSPHIFYERLFFLGLAPFSDKVALPRSDPPPRLLGLESSPGVPRSSDFFPLLFLNTHPFCPSTYAPPPIPLQGPFYCIPCSSLGFSPPSRLHSPGITSPVGDAFSDSLKTGQSNPPPYTPDRLQGLASFPSLDFVPVNSHTESPFSQFPCGTRRVTSPSFPSSVFFFRRSLFWNSAF